MSTILEDIKFSIELEEKGYNFYKATAEKAKNPLAKSTLSGLAQRELLHKEKITDFYKSLTGEKALKDGWLKEVEVPPSRKDLLAPILKKLKDSLSAKDLSTEADINEAYKIAEGLEKDSFILYTKIATETKDETAKKFFKSLAEEENEHFEILEETLEYLNRPGDWFKEKERWIVEG